MNNIHFNSQQIKIVSDIQELLETPFNGDINAMCLFRDFDADFAEIINLIEFEENLKVIEIEELLALKLSLKGEKAREIILNDFEALSKNGSDPVINIIKSYNQDTDNSFFPTDVYSFHVDRSPIPVATYLCTYFGDSSEIIANKDVVQKVRIPEVKSELMRLYNISDNEYDTFIEEYFFDLHYQMLPNSKPISLGNGNLWKLATDHPQNPVLPCVHRAPKEKNDLKRLLLIC